MSKIKELREKQAAAVAEARTYADEIGPTTDEARAKELEQAHDKAMDEYDRLDKEIQREEKLADAEARMAETDDRVPVEDRAAQPETAAAPEHREVFDKWMRDGTEGLDREERKLLKEMRAQSVGTDTAGGYTVPQGFLAELIETMQAYGPMLNPGITRELATSTGNTLDIPTVDDTSNKGAILAENTQDSEQDVAFGQKTLDAYKYTSKVIRVSEELMQDSAFAMDSFLARAMGERIGRIVNEHLTTGSGSGQPNGIVTAAGAGKTAASNSAVTFDELIDLYHSIDPAYRNAGNLRWMFSDTTLQAIRKLKDGNSNYIWQPADVRTGEPAAILGVTYTINQDMPDIGSLNSSVVFGAFDRYMVRRVREFAVKRLVERYADFYQVGFLGFGRFDGELLDTAAVKTLTHPT